jgi:drug/metabolite transporter (DMT)-like permease
MLRQLTSITLVISFIALGVSGLMMIILNSFAFQLQMHPVHKVFGIIMVLACSLHVYLNIVYIKNYLKNKKTIVLAVAMSCLLSFLFAVGINKPMDHSSIEKVEQLMSHMETKQ